MLRCPVKATLLEVGSLNPAPPDLLFPLKQIKIDGTLYNAGDLEE